MAHRRHIVHMDLDSFYVSVEVLRDSSLRGKPVLIGGDSVRGVVASCSYEARKFGIHSAMAMKKAKMLCPHAVVVRGDMEQYRRYSSWVTDIIRDQVPLFEKSSIDEFYIDLTGMDKYFGCLSVADSLAKKIALDTGLSISYALASNKLISKIATNEVKPSGCIEVPFGQEKNFLAPLPVGKIPGIGTRTATVLQQWGVHTIGDLSEISTEKLENQFGVFGRDLARRARGEDDSPVIPFHDQKSISTENTFSSDTADALFLHRETVRMTEKLCFLLRQKNKLTGCVTIKIKYANFEVVSRQVTIPYTNADDALIPVALQLFGKLYDQRLHIRLLGVRFSHFMSGSYQTNLFEDTAEQIRLYESIDHLKKRFGLGAVRKAGGI